MGLKYIEGKLNFVTDALSRGVEVQMVNAINHSETRGGVERLATSKWKDQEKKNEELESK